MSGSAVSDAAGVGKIVTDMMLKDGRYPPGYAGALTAATAVVGPIFPPSIPMVYYALVSSASIGALFLGGVVPALLICLFQGIAAYVEAKRRGFPVETAIPLVMLPAITLRALPALLMPAILLGGIYSGAFTPTEAAGVSAFYALVLAMVAYRSLTPKQFMQVVYGTVKTTAVVTVVLCGAFIFNYVVAIERVPQMVQALFTAHEMEPWLFLLLLNILFLILGCLLDVSTIQLVIVPLFIPTALALGIDLVHLGVVLVLNMMIGLITPPYGILLFIIKALNGIPLRDMIREIWPHVALLIAILFLITYVPELVLWLPRQAGAMQ
jgi:C4-dicarboxylate transporter DctM subunit